MYFIYILDAILDPVRSEVRCTLHPLHTVRPRREPQADHAQDVQHGIRVLREGEFSASIDRLRLFVNTGSPI